MDTKADGLKVVREFRDGNRPLHVIVGLQANHAFPVFRKLDDVRITILLWKDADKAEEFRTKNSLSSSSVIAMSYRDWMDSLSSLSPAQCKGCMIELVQ